MAKRLKTLNDLDSVDGPNLRRRSIRTGAINAVSGFADFAIRILSTAVLARLIAPAEFGVIMMVTAITAIADQVRELGLSAATVQRARITHEEVSNLFWINLAVGFVLTLIVCAASPFVARYYQDSRLTAVTCMLAVNFTTNGLAVQHQALLTRELKLGQTAAIRLTASVLSTALAIGLALIDYGYWALAWREVSRMGVICAGMWLVLRWVPSRPSWKTDVRPLVSFGANLTGANIVGSLSASVDRFLLGRFVGAAAVGIYRQAYQLITAPTDQLLSPLYQIMQPALSRLQNDPRRYQMLYVKALVCVCAITMPLSLFVAVFPVEITLVLLGPTWLDCAPIIQVLSFGTFVRQAVGSSAIVLITRGQGRVLLQFTSFSNVALIAFMAVGVKWGAYGVAVAEVALTYCLLWPKSHIFLKDSPVSRSIFYQTLARPALASILMAGTLLIVKRLMDTEPILSLALGATMAGPIFFLLLISMPDARRQLVELYNDVRRAFTREASGETHLNPVANIR